MPAYLVQIDGYDPVAGAAVTLRACSVDDDRVCHMLGETWWPVIARLPKLQYDLIDGGFSGRVETPASSIHLAVEPWPNLPRWTLADARVRIWEGEPGMVGPWAPRFDGRAPAQAAIADGIAELPIAVDDRWLDTPLLALYAGTTGAEGQAALKGTPKPLSIGAPRFVPGTLIDPVNIVYQLHAYGALEAVETAFERLLRFGTSVGDFASYAALVAASVPAGTWATAEAVGLVRHGAPPVPGGRFAYHVQGDRGGPEGWVRLPGSIVRRLALLAGGAGKLDEASLTALNGSRAWPLSLHQAEQITARELIQRIAASVNAVMGVSWLSKLFVAPIGSVAGAFPAPALTLDTSGAQLPMVAAVRQIEIDPPFWRMAIETERTWDVHALSDVAFQAVLVERGAWDADETYREGHIVQQAGSTWLYLNPAPTSGNAPPTLPTTSNSWWRVLAERGAQGEAGQVLYTWIAYSNAADGSVDFTTGAPGSRSYIGLANNKPSAAEGSDPSAYQWSLIKGEDGIPGTPGEDGQPTYTWIAYSNAADGSVDFTTGAPGARRYLGLSANRPTAVESADPAAYQWSLINLTGTNQQKLDGIEQQATRNLAERSIIRNSTFEGAPFTFPVGWERLSPAQFTGVPFLITGDTRSTRGRNLLVLPSDSQIASEPFAVQAGELVYLEYRLQMGINRSDGAAPIMSLVLAWYDAAGVGLANSAIFSDLPLSVAAGVRAGVAAFAAPAGAVRAVVAVWCDLEVSPQGAELLLDYLAPHRDEPGADVTSAVTGAGEIVIEFQSDGVTAKAGQLPKASVYKLIRNGAEVAATWSVATVTGSATATIANGALSVTAAPTDSRLRLTAVAAGTTRQLDVMVTRNVAPPSSSSGGGGGGGGTGGSAATDHELGGYNAVYTVISDDLTGNTGTNGQMAVSAAFYFAGQATTGQVNTIAQAQRWNGSAWVDVGTAQTSQVPATFDNEPQLGWYPSSDGYLSLSFTESGLTPNTAVKYRLLARSTSGLMYPGDGSFGIQGS